MAHEHLHAVDPMLDLAAEDFRKYDEGKIAQRARQNQRAFEVP